MKTKADEETYAERNYENAAIYLLEPLSFARIYAKKMRHHSPETGVRRNRFFQGEK